MLNEIPFGKSEIVYAGDMAHLDFQPGNMTSYQFIVTEVPEEIASRAGCGPNSYFVSYVNRNGGAMSWYFGTGGIAHTSYVKEKLRIQGDEDLLSVTAAINAFLPVYDTEYGEKCFDSIRKDD